MFKFRRLSDEGLELKFEYNSVLIVGTLFGKEDYCV